MLKKTTKCGLPLVGGIHPTFMNLIPLTFDNTLSYYEQLCAFAKKVDEIIGVVNAQSLTITDVINEIYEIINEFEADFVSEDEFNDFKTDITNYIDGKYEYLLELINNITNEGIGETIETGTVYNVGGVDYTTGDNAEIFNSYEGDSRNKAAGSYSHAEGVGNAALATGSHAEGTQTIATGNGSHAEGTATTASSQGAHAEGTQTVSSGNGSHAEGIQTTASNTASHSQNYKTTASGMASTAMGTTTHATATNAVAMGLNTYASAHEQVAMGSYNMVSNATVSKTDNGYQYNLPKYPFIIGNGYYNDNDSIAVTSDAFKIDCDGKVYVGNTLNGIDISKMIIPITQTDYDNLAVKNPTTLYVIIPEGE